MGEHVKQRQKGMGTGKLILIGLFILIIAFCAAFLLTLKFVIEPAYTYVKTENVQQYINELKQEITQKDQQIINLENELEIYKLSEDKDS